MSVIGGGGPFNPSTLTINAATRVTWTNVGNKRARVRDLDHNLIDSGDLEPGQSYSFTFCSAGTVLIGDHRGSGWATINVSSGPSASPTPSPSPGGAPANTFVRITTVTRGPNGGIALEGLGIPNRIHNVEAKSEITGDFVVIGAVTANQQGRVYFQYENDRANFAFYRFSVQ